MPTRRNSRAPVHQRDLTRHEIAIRMLVNSDPDIHRNGFRAAVRALWVEINEGNEWYEDAPSMDFLPDAYRIDRETQSLILYEVEDSNPISPSKLQKLGWFWFCWDCEDYHDWMPRLVTVDHYGRETGEIDMCGLYYSAILESERPAAHSVFGKDLMADGEDLSDDAAEFRCLVPFPDPSASFVHGFEAGMVWQRMIAGETPIENPVAYHVENRTTFERMAAAQGYDVEIEPCDDTWMTVTFTKRRLRFSVVEGGAA